LHEAFAKDLVGLVLVVRTAAQPEVLGARAAASCDRLDVVELEPVA
jgi:hypothetical protein